MGERVNHGDPVVVVTEFLPGGGSYCRLQHDGIDGHKLLRGDEQCECGVLAIGRGGAPLEVEE